MLWDAIRDFFVQHIFGGFDSIGNAYNTSLGLDYNGEELTTLDIFYNVGGNGLTNVSEPLYYSLGDYLSTTATIITITLVVIACALFVYKIIKTIGGLIR